MKRILLYCNLFWILFSLVTCIHEARTDAMLHAVRQHVGSEGVDVAIVCVASPEAVNMGMWIFGGLIAQSDYRFKQGLQTRATFRALLDDAGHTWGSMSSAYLQLP